MDGGGGGGETISARLAGSLVGCQWIPEARQGPMQMSRNPSSARGCGGVMLLEEGVREAVGVWMLGVRLLYDY